MGFVGIAFFSSLAFALMSWAAVSMVSLPVFSANLDLVRFFCRATQLALFPASPWVQYLLSNTSFFGVKCPVCVSLVLQKPLIAVVWEDQHLLFASVSLGRLLETTVFLLAAGLWMEKIVLFCKSKEQPFLLIVI